MRIFVRTLNDKTLALDVQLSVCTVDNVKSMINKSQGIPVEQIHLAYQGNNLRSGLISSYMVVDSSVLLMVRQTSMDKLNICTHPPSHPKFASVASRLETFKVWPSGKTQRPADLAKAGFFYTGEHGDGVKCFHCDIQMHSWLAIDEPWAEHAKWSEQCQFLLQFLLLLNRGKQHTTQSSRANQQSTAQKPKTFGDLRMQYVDTRAAQITDATAIGYSEETIVKAIANNNFKLFPSLTDLLDQIEHLRVNNSPMLKPIPSALPKFNSLAAENHYLQEQRLCKICMDEEVSVVFLPCGHLVSCPLCAAALSSCPICREKVVGSVRSFVA